MNDHTSEPLPLSVADLAEFGRLFDEHRTRLLAMLKRRIDPRMQARLDPEDILQGAYILAQRKWEAYRDKQTMSAYSWLYRITLDCLIESHRKATRDCRDPHREVTWPEESQVAIIMGLMDTGTRPSQAAQRQELKRRMGHAMQLLSPGDRELLCMRHFDQLSYQEIGELLNITQNTVGVRYVRALERLRGLWRKSAFADRCEHE